MGARKHNSAEAMKAARKEQYFAKANNIPTSPRKMRLVADMVRGMEVNRALGALHFSTRGGMSIKRMLPAPQGRAYRIRKRSNHVTIFVDTKNTNAEK